MKFEAYNRKHENIHQKLTSAIDVRDGHHPITLKIKIEILMLLTFL